MASGLWQFYQDEDDLDEPPRQSGMIYDVMTLCVIVLMLCDEHHVTLNTCFQVLSASSPCLLSRLQQPTRHKYANNLLLSGIAALHIEDLSLKIWKDQSTQYWSKDFFGNCSHNSPKEEQLTGNGISVLMKQTNSGLQHTTTPQKTSICGVICKENT